MIERTLTVTNPRGIHARPSALVASTAADYHASVTIYKGQQSADAASVLSVMMLAAQHGEQLRLVAEGEDAIAAIEAVAQALTVEFSD